jgi:hypothetical protein
VSLAIPSHLRGEVDACPPPPEFADAVETYARRSGRHGTLKFVPVLRCWVVQLSLKATDPALAGWQAGKLDEQPMEPVYLWREPTPVERLKGAKGFVGYNLDELGVTGLIEFLEKTDTFSGRGQYASHTEAAADQAYKGEKAREKLQNDAREHARDVAEDRRRQINAIPFLPVGIDFTPPTTAANKE